MMSTAENWRTQIPSAQSLAGYSTENIKEWPGIKVEKQQAWESMEWAQSTPQGWLYRTGLYNPPLKILNLPDSTGGLKYT